MKKLFFLLFALPFVALAGNVSVKSITAQQRNPWDGKVDVVVTIQGVAEDVANSDCLFAATNGATKTAIPVEHITRNGDDTGSGTVWTRKFIWDANADVGEVTIDDVALTVEVECLPFVQLWENGPYWAKCDVGATKPEEYGYCFWWGDTVGYKRNANDDGWISVKDSTSFSFDASSCPTWGMDNSQLRSAGYIDATGNLVAAHDAATAHLGTPWRMPTNAELDALVNNCTTTWTTRNGVVGRLVTGRGAYSSKSIFLPAAGRGNGSNLFDLGSIGYCWSSTPLGGTSGYACYLEFDSSCFTRYSFYKYFGQSVRPLRVFADTVGVSGSGMTTHFAWEPPVLKVTNVEAQQQYPWNGLLDITVTIQGLAEDVAEAECLFAARNGATKAAIPVEHIARNGDDMCSGTVLTRKFVWDAKADVGAVKIDDVVLTVEARILDYVQLWQYGPCWAKCNVGATKPEEAGYYFWWGDTVGYKRNVSNNGWISVKDSTSFSFGESSCPTWIGDNSLLWAAGYVDATGNLVAAHDAATAHLGMPWRMPTVAEFSALINNCNTTWTTRNGVVGRLVTGRGAYSAKSIFLPAAGWGYDIHLGHLGSNGSYWSSTRSLGYVAWYLEFGSSDFYWYDDTQRDNGKSVRPLRVVADTAGVAGSGMTTHFAWEPQILKVMNVEAHQRYPWNGLVDITVTLQGVAEEVADAEWSFVATNSVTKAAIPVDHITQNGEDAGSGDAWTRKFIWDAKVDVGAVKIDDVALTVDAKILGGVQLWKNGPYWAECNVGASQPEECGYYFWWGDTVGYKRNASNDGWISVKDSTSFLFNGCPTDGKSIAQLHAEGYIDATGNLVAAHDAATAHLGTPWRMPTDAEFAALISNCTTIWTTRNGVAGRLVTGKGAYSSKSIFLPAADYGSSSPYLYGLGSCGNYWSSSPNSDLDYSDCARCLYFDYSFRFGRSDYGDRYCGNPVRPVRGFAK